MQGEGGGDGKWGRDGEHDREVTVKEEGERRNERGNVGSGGAWEGREREGVEGGWQ